MYSLDSFGKTVTKMTRTQTINRAKSEGNQKIPKNRSMNHKISYCIILQRLNVVHTYVYQNGKNPFLNGLFVDPTIVPKHQQFYTRTLYAIG